MRHRVRRVGRVSEAVGTEGRGAGSERGSQRAGPPAGLGAGGDDARPTEKPAADSGMSERFEGQVKHAMFLLCGGACQYLSIRTLTTERLLVVRMTLYRVSLVYDTVMRKPPLREVWWAAGRCR